MGNTGKTAKVRRFYRYCIITKFHILVYTTCSRVYRGRESIAKNKAPGHGIRKHDQALCNPKVCAKNISGLLSIIPAWQSAQGSRYAAKASRTGISTPAQRIASHTVEFKSIDKMYHKQRRMQHDSMVHAPGQILLAGQQLPGRAGRRGNYPDAGVVARPTKRASHL